MGAPRRSAAVLVLAAAVGTAGCGGGEEGGSTAASKPATSSTQAATAVSSGRIALSADRAQLRYDKPALTAPAGKVTIVMANPSAIPHDVAIEGDGVNTRGKTVGQGGTSTVSADLKPGTYTFYCSVGGHRQAGMKGTLTVE